MHRIDECTKFVQKVKSPVHQKQGLEKEGINQTLLISLV